MKPIIFLRTAWMIHYRGVTKTDVPNGAGSFVKSNRDGGEVANFLNIGSKYYGYARIRKGNDLRIERLGASKNDDFIDDVIVVFFATNPHLGGQYVVGWYDKARLYRSLQDLDGGQRKGHPYYLAVTAVNNGKLLPTHLRKFELPDDGPGQTNAWYVNEYRNANAFLDRFSKFKNNPEAYRQKLRGLSGSGWQADAEKRKKTEIAAMDATADYFVQMGFNVSYVHNENLGWDLEAQKGNKKLLLEVKGTAGPLSAVTLTPNEYINSRIKENYRICILEQALDKSSAQLHICRINANKKVWISESGDKLKIVEIKSAQLVKQ